MSVNVLIVENQRNEFDLIPTWLGLTEEEAEWFDPNQGLPTDEKGITMRGAQTTEHVRVRLMNRIWATQCRVVLMDLELTTELFDHTGGVLTREVKALCPNIGVIWISAMPVEQQLDRWKEYRADEGWRKPWKPGGKPLDAPMPEDWPLDRTMADEIRRILARKRPCTPSGSY